MNSEPRKNKNHLEDTDFPVASKGPINSVSTTGNVSEWETLYGPSDPDLLEFLSGYFEEDSIRRIGNGSYGFVYVATRLKTKERVALKILQSNAVDHQRVEYASETLKKLHIQQEKSIQKDIQTKPFIGGKNIIRYYEILKPDASKSIVVMEFVDGITLKSACDKRTFLDWELKDIIARLLIPLVEGLCLMHSHKVVHRDISWTNVMFRTGSFEPVFIDVDFIKDLERETVLTDGQHEKFTQLFKDPDRNSLKTNNPRLDVYSLGIVFFGVLHGHLDVFGLTVKSNKGSSGKSSVNEISKPEIQKAKEEWPPIFSITDNFSGNGKRDSKFNPGLKEILISMLDPDYNLRMQSGQVLTALKNIIEGKPPVVPKHFIAKFVRSAKVQLKKPAMAKSLIAGVVVILVAVIGYAFFVSKQQSNLKAENAEIISENQNRINNRIANFIEEVLPKLRMHPNVIASEVAILQAQFDLIKDEDNRLLNNIEHQLLLGQMWTELADRYYCYGSDSLGDFENSIDNHFEGIRLTQNVVDTVERTEPSYVQAELNLAHMLKRRGLVYLARFESTGEFVDWENAKSDVLLSNEIRQRHFEYFPNKRKSGQFVTALAASKEAVGLVYSAKDPQIAITWFRNGENILDQFHQEYPETISEQNQRFLSIEKNRLQRQIAKSSRLLGTLPDSTVLNADSIFSIDPQKSSSQEFRQAFSTVIFEADNYMALEKFENAKKLFTKTIIAIRGRMDVEKQDVQLKTLLAYCLIKVAQTHLSLGELDQVQNIFDECCELLENSPQDIGVKNASLASIYLVKSKLALSRKQFDKCEIALNRAKEFLRTIPETLILIDLHAHHHFLRVKMLEESRSIELSEVLTRCDSAVTFMQNNAGDEYQIFVVMKKLVELLLLRSRLLEQLISETSDLKEADELKLRIVRDLELAKKILSTKDEKDERLSGLRLQVNDALKSNSK